MTTLLGPDGTPLAAPAPKPKPEKAKRERRRLPATLGRAAALLVPLVLVNASAIFGQAGWAFDHLVSATFRAEHLTTAVLVSVLFAGAVESIGVYLAWEAHSALMADQAAGLLRMGSYAVGLLVGTLNYLHFAGDGGSPTAQAVTFGALSSLSPWLWAIRSRSLNRGRLAELGLIDERGVKLSSNRKLWHPWRSIGVMSWAAWAGVTNPAAAVAGWTAYAAEKKTAKADTRRDTKAVGKDAEPVSGPPAMSSDAPDESAGGALSGVLLDAERAAKATRALAAYDPDMTPDMIAAFVGKSPRTVTRYLKPSSNGRSPS